MKTCLVVPFIHYHGTTPENSRLLFDFFLKTVKIWRNEVDKIYVIDSGDFLPETEGITLIKKPRQSHWQNLNEVLGTLTEDAFLLMDSDTVIYRPGVVGRIFELLARNHVVSIMDNSGGKALEKTYSQLQPNKYRSVRRRFAPYLFGCQKAFWHRLDNPDFTPTTGPEWTDSMGTVTEQIMSLKPVMCELPDDRTTLYYNEGNFQTTQWLDGDEFGWSTRVSPDYGYYHLRNMGGALQLIQAFIEQNETWQKALEITPQNELYRLLTWAQIITGHNLSIVPIEYRGAHLALYPWIKDLA